MPLWTAAGPSASDVREAIERLVQVRIRYPSETDPRHPHPITHDTLAPTMTARAPTRPRVEGAPSGPNGEFVTARRPSAASNTLPFTCLGVLSRPVVQR
jgi:hypothetical protein